MLNLGNPWLFLGHSDDWTNKVSAEVGSIWIDVQGQYTDNIANYWQGDAQAALLNYLIRKVQPATDALKALANDFATQTTTLSGAVMTSDFAVIGLVLASAVFMNACLALDMATLGAAHAGLITAVLAYLGALTAWITSVVNLFQAFQTALTSLHQKANDVKNAIWVDGQTRQDPSRIALPPETYDNDNINNDYWKRNPNLDK